MTAMKDSCVLITGASSGIGAACTRQFAAAGAQLILIARRMERLRKLANEIDAPVHLIELDIRDRSKVTAAIESIPETFRAIDVLVNNAGLGRGLDKLHEGSIDGWEEMIDTNVKGLLYVSRAVIPGMVARGRGPDRQRRFDRRTRGISRRQRLLRHQARGQRAHQGDAARSGRHPDKGPAQSDPGLVETEFSSVRFYGDNRPRQVGLQGISAADRG